jgi:hypothetical protein
MAKVTFFRVSAQSQRKPANRKIETQLGYFIDPKRGGGRGGYCTKNVSAFSACGDCSSARKLREGVPDQWAVDVKLPPCVTVPRNRHRDLVALDDFAVRNFRTEWRYDSNPVVDVKFIPKEEDEAAEAAG